MVAVFLNMIVHFFFLIWDTIRKIRLSIRKKIWMRNVAKLRKTKEQEKGSGDEIENENSKIEESTGKKIIRKDSSNDSESSL